MYCLGAPFTFSCFEPQNITINWQDHSFLSDLAFFLWKSGLPINSTLRFLFKMVWFTFLRLTCLKVKLWISRPLYLPILFLLLRKPLQLLLSVITLFIRPKTNSLHYWWRIYNFGWSLLIQMIKKCHWRCHFLSIILGSALGDCVTDSFSITSPGSIGSPEICGTNSGQHSKFS